MSTSFDVVVVGSGACGGLAARQLTARGLKVCLLEAGPANPSPSTEQARAQPVQSKSLAYSSGLSHLFVDDLLNPYTTPADSPFVWIRGRQLGGRTQMWATHCPRLSPLELSAPASDPDGGQCWPLSYAELEREYDEVEKIIHVVGAAEAAFSAPTAHHRPARRMNDAEAAVRKAVEDAWPTRRVVLSPYAAMVESDDADRLEAGDRYRAYMLGDATRGPFYSCSTRSTLRDALATGNLVLRTDAVVSSVEVSADGKHATGVAFVDRLTGERDRIDARNVMLCASSLESTRILLNSCSERWPTGLANSSGVLGRFVSDHLWGVGVNAWRAGDLPRTVSWPPLYVPPFSLEATGEVTPFQFYCALLQDGPGRIAMRIRGSGEASSLSSNRVTLDRSVVDAWNIPVLRISCVRSSADIARAEAMSKCAVEIAEAAGFTVLERTPLEAPGVSIHEVGTARMGRDPRTSVVDSDCRSWDIPNLYVADGAVFPRATARPPTLTMMALASRACRRVSATEIDPRSR